MRPIQLKGHSRPVSQVVFNYDGDLLFTGSQDKNISVWYTHNGERLGSYSGQGAIASLLVDRTTRCLLSGAGDGIVRAYDVETGNKITEGDMGVPVKSMAFAEGERQFAVLCPAKMGQKLDYVKIFNLNQDLKRAMYSLTHNRAEKDTPTCLLFSPLNNNLYVATDTGYIDVYDIRNNCKFEGSIHPHEEPIVSMQFSSDLHTIITASKDKTAKLLHSNSLETIRTYKSDKPINGASISTIMDHVIVGGGQEARDVTTKGEEGGFQVRFYSKIYENFIGLLDLGHIGPINALTFSPDCKALASGGEDSVVYLCHFDDAYFDEQ